MKKKASIFVDLVFDKIWECWNNKTKENAARKALEVTINSGENHEDIIRACKIYSLEVEGDELTYQLNNFLLQDHWKDYLEVGDLAKLEKRRQEAIEVIEEWNKVCRSHWCKVEDVETRVPLATKALANESFRKNWKKSLDKASKIFQYRFREGDVREKIILSFRWFCNVSPDRHTVLRILEGEYGNPPQEPSEKTVKPFKKINQTHRNKALEYFRGLRKGKINPETPNSRGDD